MIIDVAYFLVLLLAVFKGFRKGFIVAIFSFFAFIIGLAAALKLSVVVADWLGKNTGIGTRLLPVVAFAAVMLGVALLVRLCAVMIEKTLQLAMLGFVNKLAGILLYFIIYTIVFSVVLFFANKIHLFKEDTIAASRCFGFVAPWGPKAIDMLGTLVPWFNNMFQQLTHFFDGIAKREAA